MLSGCYICRWVLGNHKAEAMLLAISEAGPFKVGCIDSSMRMLMCAHAVDRHMASHKATAADWHKLCQQFTVAWVRHAGRDSDAPDCSIHMAELCSLRSARDHPSLVHAGLSFRPDSAQCS